MPDAKPIDLPDDFENVLRDLLNTPPPEKEDKKSKGKPMKRDEKKTRR